MIKQLKTSNRVKQEVEFYREKINNLNNEKLKQQANKLLQELQTQIHLIDETHSTIGNNLQIDPRLSRNNVPKVVELRKQLNQLLL
jgi:preprotein translocase subunit SecA